MSKEDEAYIAGYTQSILDKLAPGVDFQSLDTTEKTLYLTAAVRRQQAIADEKSDSIIRQIEENHVSVEALGKHLRRLAWTVIALVGLVLSRLFHLF